MTKKPTLKQLQKEIAHEKRELKQLQERERLERKLKRLKESKRNDIPGRIGRGLGVLSKKAGKVIVKQAHNMRDRQIEEEKRNKKKVKGGFQFDPLGDF